MADHKKGTLPEEMVNNLIHTERLITTYFFLYLFCNS